jgi:hypothetical protein
LQWCGTTLVVAGALGSSGCGHWVPGGKLNIMYGPVPAKAQAGRVQPERAECKRLCAEDASNTGVCQLATLGMDPVTPKADGAARVVRGSTVVICEVEVPGRYEHRSYLPTPFGRRWVEPIEAGGEPPHSASGHFERAAGHEAAAVIAFRQLAFDLAQLGAPDGLIAQARRAARDEAHHARWTLALARRYDPRARLRRPDQRRAVRRQVTMFELAVENATAGCVGELFGTWLQVFQARAATSPLVRATARRIAQDEARHAALAFQLFDWLDYRLGPREREAVRMAMHAEAELLGRAPLWSDELASGLGLPDRAQMAQASAALQERLPAACA